MSKRFGLPTYPINGGMIVGKRDADELEWLLDHGDIRSDLYAYGKIKKISANEYQLVKMVDARYDSAEELIRDANTLESLLELGRLDTSIRYWYWYSHPEK